MVIEHWVLKAQSDLGMLSKEQLIEKIIKKRKETYSKTGKRNVATGKTHERRCKKLLTEWSGVEFRRRRVEGRGDDVSVIEGFADIIPVSGKSLFVIESKKGEGFSLDALFADAYKAKFTEWWHQVNYDAILSSKQAGEKRWPMLFFKPIPAWDWIALPTGCFEQQIFTPDIKSSEESKTRWRARPTECWFPHISFDAYRWFGPIAHNIAASNKNKVLKAIKLEPCIICRWKDFAGHVDHNSTFVQT